MKIEYLCDNEQHVPTLAAWHHAQFGYLSPNSTLASRQEKLEATCRKDALPITLIALSDEGDLLGSASILITTITHQHLTPWLSTVFVAEKFRGHGIASGLSLRMIGEAKRLGYDQLYLFTPHNERLYARLGWETFGRATHNGTEVVLMQWAI
jgi:predicted N-acetyltransferase YhbS